MGQEERRRVWFVVGVCFVGMVAVLLIPAVFQLML